MKDLTKGNPSILILTFALPIFLGNLLQLTYSLVDTRIVGSFLGEDALAAVGATTTLSNLIIGFLFGMCNGFGILTAQYFGAKNMDRLRRSFAHALEFGIVIAILLTAAGLFFLKPILVFLNVPDGLTQIAYDYIAVIIAGLIATLLYDVFAATLRAMGNTVIPLIILFLSVVLNIGGDLLFVAVWDTGVWGAALATVLSQVIAAVVCGVYIYRKYPLLRVKLTDFAPDDPSMVRNIISSGLSMGFMSSLVNIGSLTLQTSINRLGQNIIIAHTAARKISEIFMIMFSVFGQTMATYCGQNIGAGEIKRIKKGILLAIGYTCIWCVLNIITSYTISPWLVSMITDSHNPVVIENATAYLKFDTLFYFVPAVICILRNSLQGLGERVVPIISSFLEMSGKVVIAATLVPLLNYTGVILAEPIVWFIMVIPLVVKIFRMPVLKEEPVSN